MCRCVFKFQPDLRWSIDVSLLKKLSKTGSYEVNFRRKTYLLKVDPTKKITKNKMKLIKIRTNDIL